MQRLAKAWSKECEDKLHGAIKITARIPRKCSYKKKKKKCLKRKKLGREKSRIGFFAVQLK